MTFLKKFVDSSRELSNVKAIAVCAMMLALRIVLGAFANITLAFLPLQVVKISFTFLPIIITAYLYGPVCAGIIAGAGDALCYVIAPTGFGYLPGITLCCIIEGIIYGIFLYKTELKVKNLVIAKAVDMLICTIPLNSILLQYYFFQNVDLYVIMMFRAAVLILFGVIEVLIIILIRTPLLKAEKQLHKK